MPIPVSNLSGTFWQFPADHLTGRAAFLELLHSPGETWVSAYALTEMDLLDEIAKADANGVPVHLLLDHTQFMGHAEHPEIVALAAKLQHGDVTITTAGPGGPTSGAIHHEKSMVVAATDGGQAHVWFGSVNFSGSDAAHPGGWGQDNDALLVRSDAIAGAIVQAFTVKRAWARAQEASYQIAALSTANASIPAADGTPIGTGIPTTTTP